MSRPDFRAAASLRLAEDADHSPALANYLAEVPSRMTVRELAVGQIEAHPQRMSRASDTDDFDQLARSIRAYGVQAPLLVRPLPSNRFQLIAGDRRLRAARSVGLATVPVVIRDLDDETALELVTGGASRRTPRSPQIISRDPDASGYRREPIVISGSDLTASVTSPGRR